MTNYSFLFKIAILLLSSNSIIAQAPSWSYNIGDLIYNNCSSCHHEGGIAPFSLMSYEDAFLFIDFALEMAELCGKPGVFSQRSKVQVDGHQVIVSVQAFCFAIVEDCEVGG